MGRKQKKQLKPRSSFTTPSSPHAKEKKKWISGSMTIIYIIIGIFLIGIFASGMLSKTKKGSKKWGEKCFRSNECVDGVCFPDKDGISKCFPLCLNDKKCPLGFKCETRMNPKRRSLGMISICVEK